MCILYKLILCFTRSARCAFSLVELSIILVILGLLVGGVLAGQSLIRASELRSISTQYNQYNTAVLSFRDKYFALPGDMANATQFWGEAAVPASCAATVSTDAKTCDGDGNAKIGTPIGAYESARAWQHLANADLIEGQFNGVNLLGGPKGKISKSYWTLQDYGTQSGNISAFDGDYNNSLFINSFTGSIASIPFLKPEDAWNIDVKMDDGMPATGKTVVYVRGLSNCTDTADPTLMSAQYLLSSSTIGCSLIFRNQF